MSASSIFIAACYSLYNLWLFQILLDFHYQTDNSYFMHIFLQMLVSKLFSFTWFTALLRGIFQLFTNVHDVLFVYRIYVQHVGYSRLRARISSLTRTSWNDIRIGAIPFFKVQKPFTTVIGFRYEPISWEVWEEHLKGPKSLIRV